MAQILMQWKNSLRNSLRFSHDSDSGKSTLSDTLLSSDVLDQFEAAEATILKWKDMRESFLWKGYIDEAKEYLSAVDTILDNQAMLSSTEISERFDSVKTMSLLRLMDEFRNMLTRSVVRLEPEQVSGQLSNRFSMSRKSFAISDAGSSVDFDGESVGVEKGGNWGYDLMTESVVDGLKEIAERMIRAGRKRECGSIYACARRDAMYDFLVILGGETVSIEDLQKSEWKSLDRKMRKWIRAVKTFTRYLLFAERDLCINVFTGYDDMMRSCFTLVAEECVLQLLDFGEVIVKVNPEPEMLLRLFDMYDTLAKSQVDLKELFSCGFGDIVFSRTENVLSGLREAVTETFAVFDYKVRNDMSPVLSNGDIPRLVRYVMNYVQLIVDCGERLNILLGGNLEWDNASSPLGDRVLELITSLETNVEMKSKLYEDESLGLIFLISNTNYMILKVKKNPKLVKLLGENWLRKHISQLRKYPELYLKASWKNVLSIFDGHGKIPDARVKAKFRQFNAAFEEIYKRQSAWLISEPQLRDELRISISERLIPAYKTFLGWVGVQVDSLRNADKYRKYEIDDFDNFLMDLFHGKSRDLQKLKWKTEHLKLYEEV